MIFATNRLPPFMGGFDRGCQRRLLVVKFDSSIDAEKMIAAIGDRILDEESDLMLAWAIAGASRLIRQGGFSTCPSSIAALRDWLHDADPVKMWTAERVREGETPEVINQDGYVRPEIYGFFTHWAEENGYRKDRLPGSPEFFNRLAEDYPIIVKRTAGSRRIRGITVLLTDEDGQKTPRDISEIVEPYRNATAAGLLRPPGSAAYVNENGNPVWGEELDVALRRTVN